MKYISMIIKEFEKLSYKDYVQKRPKHEPTDSYFYLERQISKCMVTFYALNFPVYSVRAEINGTQQILILHVCD